MGFNVAAWMAGVGAAISIKVSSSIDDIVWLAPFLTSNEGEATRAKHAIIYISVCMVQTLVAMILAYCGDAVVKFLTAGNKDAWSSEKILTVGAGVMLLVYSVKLWHEHLTEEGNDEEKIDGMQAEVENDRKALLDMEAQKLATVAVDSDETTRASTDGSASESEQEQAGKSRAQALFLIAFLGSVDDLTLFVPMLVGKGFDMVQLALGALTAGLGIVLVCIFLGMCKPIANCLSSIPLGAIVTTFATMLLVKGYFME